MTTKPNSRAHGYSLRQSLMNQGVTTEEALRKHLAFVLKTQEINKSLDITRYRVSRNYPNGEPYMG